nr:MAG TPA: hypothetical protein [Herelleviridae sp.]
MVYNSTSHFCLRYVTIRFVTPNLLVVTYNVQTIS